MSGNKIKFLSDAQRKQHIDTKRQTGDETYNVFWKGAYKPYLIREVPINFPFFNLRNTRTIDTQLEYIKKNNKNDDFFKTLDDEEAQNAQFQIIRDNYISTTGNQASSIVYTNLKNGIQTEPLILTSDYKVISGNRRLCIMIDLDLTAQEKNQERKFEYIKIILLPKGTEQEEEELEHHLEDQQTGKINFEWTAKALKIRELRRKYKWSEIAAMRKETGKSLKAIEDHLKESLAMLTFGDQYLQHINKKGEYSEIHKHEWSLRGVYRGIKNGDFNFHPKKKTWAINQCFKILDSPGGTGARGKYGAITDFFKSFDVYYKVATKGTATQQTGKIGNPLNPKGIIVKIPKEPRDLTETERILLQNKIKAEAKRIKEIDKYKKYFDKSQSHLEDFFNEFRKIDEEIKNQVIKQNKGTLKKLESLIEKIKLKFE